MDTRPSTSNCMNDDVSRYNQSACTSMTPPYLQQTTLSSDVSASSARPSYLTYVLSRRKSIPRTVQWNLQLRHVEGSFTNEAFCILLRHRMYRQQGNVSWKTFFQGKASLYIEYSRGQGSQDVVGCWVAMHVDFTIHIARSERKMHAWTQTRCHDRPVQTSSSSRNPGDSSGRTHTYDTAAIGAYIFPRTKCSSTSRATT